jgi:hypothetical protein
VNIGENSESPHFGVDRERSISSELPISGVNLDFLSRLEGRLLEEIGLDVDQAEVRGHFVDLGDPARLKESIADILFTSLSKLFTQSLALFLGKPGPEFFHLSVAAEVMSGTEVPMASELASEPTAEADEQFH